MMAGKLYSYILNLWSNYGNQERLLL